MNGDECPDMFLEFLVIGMVVTVEYENELRNRLEPAQFSLILSRQALGYALQGITIVNLYDVARHARCPDNDIRKRVGSAELDFLLDAHRLGFNSILRHVHEAADAAREFFYEQT